VPVVFRWQGFSFHFYSNEGNPREPIHVHVRRGRDDAKFWLFPDVAVAYNRGFSSRELSELVAIAEQRRDELESAWNEHFA
jgi:hypothetical protein